MFAILEKYLRFRLSLKGYIFGLMKQAHETGAPLMRAMFYEFPDDQHCWELCDQYMFGSAYLVAPVVQQGAVSRSVYLPKGKWQKLWSGEIFQGGCTLVCAAPLDSIPVFLRLE